MTAEAGFSLLNLIALVGVAAAHVLPREALGDASCRRCRSCSRSCTRCSSPRAALK